MNSVPSSETIVPGRPHRRMTGASQYTARHTEHALPSVALGHFTASRHSSIGSVDRHSRKSDVRRVSYSYCEPTLATVPTSGCYRCPLWAKIASRSPGRDAPIAAVRPLPGTGHARRRRVGTAFDPFPAFRRSASRSNSPATRSKVGVAAIMRALVKVSFNSAKLGRGNGSDSGYG